MANFTETAIKETFIKMLEERPLNEITVKELARECGINRNSFYYHFRDIPALMEEILMEETERIIQKYPSVNSMVECFDAIVDFCSCRKREIMHIFRSIDREVFEMRLSEISGYFIRQYLNSALAEEAITAQDKETIITYYKGVCFGVALDWFNHGMREDYAKSIRNIFILKKNLALEIAQLLQDQV